MRLLLTLIMGGLIFVGTPAVAADNLTDQQIKNFIATMDDMRIMAEEMSAEGKDKFLNGKIQAMEGGEFTAYQQSAEVLKEELPEDYSQLQDMVKENGFSSVEDWAQIGDDVMAAYVTMQITPETREKMDMMKQMQGNPEMMAQMPSEAQQALAQSQAMIKAIENVPAENVEAIKPYREEIKTALDAYNQNKGTEG
jgi:hypothetical protein